MSKIAKILGMGPPKLPALPEPVKVPSVADPAIKLGKDRQARAAKLAGGRGGTQVARQDALGDAPVRRASLLGQTGQG